MKATKEVKKKKKKERDLNWLLDERQENLKREKGFCAFGNR